MPQQFENSTPEEDEAQTEIFLNSNGPDDGEFDPVIPPELLSGKSKSEKWLYEQTDKSIRQNNYLIRQVTGLKRAHRVEHLRFQSLSQKIEPLHNLWNKWLTGKKFVRNAFLALLTLFLLPFLALFMVEVVKHWLGWK